MNIATALGVKFNADAVQTRDPLPMSDADREAAFFAEIGSLPTVKYVAPTQGMPIAPDPPPLLNA